MTNQVIFAVPFQGHIETVARNGVAEYTGGKSVVNYLQEKESENPDKHFYCIDENYFYDLYDVWLNNQYIEAEPVKETEDRYEYMFECLPPIQMGRYKGYDAFMMMEALTDNIHSVYIKTPNNEYYSVYAKRTEKIEKTIERFIKRNK